MLIESRICPPTPNNRQWDFHSHSSRKSHWGVSGHMLIESRICPPTPNNRQWDFHSHSSRKSHWGGVRAYAGYEYRIGYLTLYKNTLLPL